MFNKKEFGTIIKAMNTHLNALEKLLQTVPAESDGAKEINDELLEAYRIYRFVVKAELTADEAPKTTPFSWLADDAKGTPIKVKAKRL